MGNKGGGKTALPTSFRFSARSSSLKEKPEPGLLRCSIARGVVLLDVAAYQKSETQTHCRRE